MAGLLTRSTLYAFPFCASGWKKVEATVAKIYKACIELTAAGTVSDFHGIPFSSLQSKEPYWAAKVGKF